MSAKTKPVIDATPERLRAISLRGKELATPRDFQGRPLPQETAPAPGE